MTLMLNALDRVPETHRSHVTSYARLVSELAGENAASVIIYGDVLGGEFDTRRVAIQSVVILRRMDLQFLRLLAGHGARLARWGIAAPLVLTPEYIRSSLDAFPLELMEITQLHWTVFGEDLFAGISLADADVRLQCEREVKRLLIGLRQGLLATAGRERMISSLEHEAAEGLSRAVRGILWLRGQRDYLPRAQALQEVAKIAGRGFAGMQAALDRTSHPGWREFEQLHSDVEALGELVRA